MDAPSESTLLQILERIESEAPADNQRLSVYLASLRVELEQQEKDSVEQKQMLAKYEEAYQKLTSPANRIGVFLKLLGDGNALVALGDTEYAALIDPAIEPNELQSGVRVRLNDAYAIVGTMPQTGVGGLIKVTEVLADGRMKVGADSPGSPGRLVDMAESLKEAKVQPGDEIRLDATGRVAVEHFPRQETKDYFIEDVPETPWSKVGGQDHAISLIRETIEQPLLHPELYAKFDKKPVKGILLYGPPGCGKTLIGKAIAYNLAREYSEKKGIEIEECFMHISGPKILNMWLGETERIVREIFAAARARSKDGQLVVIFIDEAESILRTRSGGRYLNISNTVVPQFCAEMDGLVELENVVLVITSNRPDYIDPAILRPERIDRKVKITRPNKEASREILGLYLTESLPLAPEEIKEHDGAACARKALIESTLAHLWRTTEATAFLKVSYRSSRTETLHWKDMVSGALLKSVIDRAKDTAIRRAIADPKHEHGISEQDLHQAVDSEFAENEIFPKSDVLEDWLKLIDVDPESVVAVRPIREDKRLRRSEAVI